MGSARISKISTFVAAICIAIYIMAIGAGAVRISDSIGTRRNNAEREFYDLADRASSSAVFMGFMSGPYQESIRDYLGASEALLGVIITDSSGEHTFERFKFFLSSPYSTLTFQWFLNWNKKKTIQFCLGFEQEKFQEQ